MIGLTADYSRRESKINDDEIVDINNSWPRSCRRQYQLFEDFSKREQQEMAAVYPNRQPRW
jgi:hypothetical protein